MNLNLSKFKKVECDNNCTVLQHPGGHLIKIAHKGLSPESKSQLDEMPIHKAFGGVMKNFEASKASKPAKSSNTMPGSPTDSSKAYTEPDSMGTDIPKQMLQNSKTMPDVVLEAMHRAAPPLGPLGADEKQHYPPCINPSCKSYGHSHPNCRCYGGHPEGEASFAKGGKVEQRNFCDDNRAHFKDCEYYAGGGQTPQSQPPQQPQPVQTNQEPQLAAQAQASMRKAFHYAQGGAAPDETPTQDPSMQQAPVEDDESVNISPTDTANNTAENPDINPNPELSGTDQTPNQPTPASADDGADDSQDQDADREPASAPQEAPPASVQNQQTPAQQVQQKKGDDLDHMIGESQAYNNDLQNGHIKPETYQSLFAKQDTLGKIGTLFGLLVSGAGSGLAHQQNAVMGMMDQQIKNDLQAQETSASNKQNFLKINMQNQMNLALQKQMAVGNKLTAAQAQQAEVGAKQKAWALSMVQQRQTALHQLVLNTMKMPEGPQKQLALQTLAMMNKTVQGENFNIMDQAATASALGSFLGGQGGTGNTMLMKSGALGDEAAKVGEDKEQKTIPNIVQGIASRPLAAQDIQTLTNKQAFDKATQQYIDFSNKYKGNWANLNLAQRTKIASQGQALTQDLLAKYQASKPSATAAELNDLKNSSVIEPAAKWNSAFKGIPKAQQVLKDNQIEANTLAGSYGLKYIPGNRTTEQSPVSKNQASIGDIKNSNGFPYKFDGKKWNRVK